MSISQMFNQRVDTNERGVAMLESLAVLPIMIAVGLFSVDLFFFSKSKTDLNQVAREAAIFFATYPDTSGTNGTQTDTHMSPAWGDACILDPTNISESTQEDIDECEHISTQERAYRLLVAQKSYLNISRSNVHITTSKVGKIVQLTLTADVKVSFFFNNKTISSTAILRKIA